MRRRKTYNKDVSVEHINTLAQNKDVSARPVLHGSFLRYRGRGGTRHNSISIYTSHIESNKRYPSAHIPSNNLTYFTNLSCRDSKTLVGGNHISNQGSTVVGDQYSGGAPLSGVFVQNHPKNSKMGPKVQKSGPFWTPYKYFWYFRGWKIHYNLLASGVNTRRHRLYKAYFMWLAMAVKKIVVICYSRKYSFRCAWGCDWSLSCSPPCTFFRWHGSCSVINDTIHSTSRSRLGNRKSHGGMQRKLLLRLNSQLSSSESCDAWPRGPNFVQNHPKKSKNWPKSSKISPFFNTL